MAPKVVLIGPPGSGKSTVGRLLAHRVDTPFVDTDVLIATDAGKSISDIFVDDGEPAFRAIERRIVLDALRSSEGVLALGGGAILDSDVCAAIKLFNTQGGATVYLSVTLTGAAPRVGFDRDRPLLLGNPRAQWQVLMDARRSIYEELSTIQFDTSDLSANLVADSLADQLGVGS
ncbi:MAG: shikimate kinase [Actinomycetes bacterium]